MRHSSSNGLPDGRAASLQNRMMDIHLPMDSVDIPVRAPPGLDVDPGWVPWLGTVVRFRYE